MVVVRAAQWSAKDTRKKFADRREKNWKKFGTAKPVFWEFAVPVILYIKRKELHAGALSVITP